MELVRPDIKAHTQIVQFKVAKYANLPFHLLAWGGEYIREYNCAILNDIDNNVGNKTESNRNLNSNVDPNLNTILNSNSNSNQNTNSNVNSNLNSKARKLSSDRSSRRKLSSESIFGDLFNRKKRRHAKRENQDSELPSVPTTSTSATTSTTAPLITSTSTSTSLLPPTFPLTLPPLHLHLLHFFMTPTSMLYEQRALTRTAETAATISMATAERSNADNIHRAETQRVLGE